MLSVLFWNVSNKDLRQLVCDAVNATSSDVVILIENSVSKDDMLNNLQANVSPSFAIPASSIERFHLFSRSPDLDLSEVYGGDRVSIRRMKFCAREFLLAAVHVVDRFNWDPANQAVQVHLLSEEIQRQERSTGIDRTILIGDFNLNPFDQIMNMAPGMNAMATIQCVRRESREQQSKVYPFFYNPMWSLFGDRTPGPAGTFYHTTASRGMYGWNMLDQVLIRPAAIDWFDDVQILTNAGTTPLQTATNRPNRTIGSDHFPILLKLKII